MIRLKLIGACAVLWAMVALSLCSCAAVAPLVEHALQPNQHCAANGVSWKLVNGHQSWGAGCIEQAPVPGEQHARQGS